MRLARVPTGFLTAALLALALSSLPPLVVRLQAATAKTDAQTDNGCVGLTFTLAPTGSDTFAIFGETHFDVDNSVTTTLLVNGSATGVVHRTNYDFGGNTRELNEWYLINPSNPSVVTITYSGGGPDGDCGAGGTSYSGVHQTVPLGTQAQQTEQNTGSCAVSPSGGDSAGSIYQLAFGNGTTLAWSGTQGWEQESLDGGSASVGSQDTFSAASGTLTATLGASGLNTCIGEVILPAGAAATCTGQLMLMGAGKCDNEFSLLQRSF